LYCDCCCDCGVAPVLPLSELLAWSPALESDSAEGAPGAGAGGGAGVEGEVGIAGDVILSRASGNCAASAGGDEGLGVESIVSRYGSTSPYDSDWGVCDCCPDGRDLRPRRKGRRRSLMQLWCG